MKANIILEKCPVQPDMCQPMKQCPQQAIIFEEDINEMFGGRMFIDQSKCDGCADCVELCCGQAIEMIIN